MNSRAGATVALSDAGFSAEEALPARPEKCRVGKVRVDRMRFEEAHQWIVEAIQTRSLSRPLLLFGVNAQVINLADESAQFAQVMESADVCMADGISVVLASRAFNRAIPERIPCGEMMERLCESGAKTGLRVFFLGGLPSAAETAANTLVGRYPGLVIAGHYSPPYGFEKNPEQRQAVRDIITAARPDILFVAFGVPKQETWIYNDCRDLPVGAVLTVGAAFDTMAGLRKRAPEWAQKTGTEWLYRLVKEPRRLWKRYLLGNPKFVALILRQRMQGAAS